MIVNSGKSPCGVCGKGVRENSVQCTIYIQWIHGVRGDLSRVADGFSCRRCDGTIQEVDLAENLIVDGETYECVKSFCYLGDTIDGDGGADLAATARIRNGWMKFRELLPFLTSSGLPLHNIPFPFLSVMDISSSISRSAISASTLSNHVFLERKKVFQPVFCLQLYTPYISSPSPHHMSIPSQSTTSNESCDRLNSNQPSQFFICPSVFQ